MRQPVRHPAERIDCIAHEEERHRQHLANAHEPFSGFTIEAAIRENVGRPQREDAGRHEVEITDRSGGLARVPVNTRPKIRSQRAG